MVAVGLVSLFAEASASGIWLALIGWFLASAARSSYVQTQIHHMLEGVRADDVMTPDLVAVPADVTLQKP